MLSEFFSSAAGRSLRFWRLLAALPLLVVCAGTQAAAVTVVLSDESAPYQEAAAAIEAALKPQHGVTLTTADRLASGTAPPRASLLVTVGIRAAEQVAEQGGSTPVLAVLVTEDWYEKQGRGKLTAGGRQAGVILLEQPLSRQFRLIRAAFPHAAKVAAVVGRGNAAMLDRLHAAAEAEGLALVGAVAESETTLVSTLSGLLKEADLLLAVPDSEVLNRNTVQAVLMTTYRYRDPVVGYSKALARAGALLSLYSTPEQIGRQAGETAAKTLAGGKLPALQWPKYFAVSVNAHVARSLAIDVPAEETLLRELRNGNE